MAGDSNAEPTSGSGGVPSAAQGRGSSTNECEKMIQRSLRDPTVKFLKEQLEKSGCGIGSNFIKGYASKQAIAGGFSTTAGAYVVITSKKQEQVTQLVIRQLIYAYDYCGAANMDLNNCAHHACIEHIRAGHLSGDCHYKRELARGFLKLRGHEQECLRRRVLQSLAANPNCLEIGAKDAMEAVWDICYNDTKPLIELLENIGLLLLVRNGILA